MFPNGGPGDSSDPPGQGTGDRLERDGAKRKAVTLVGERPPRRLLEDHRHRQSRRCPEAWVRGHQIARQALDELRREAGADDLDQVFLTLVEQQER